MSLQFRFFKNEITSQRMLIGLILITKFSRTYSQENLSCVCRNVTHDKLWIDHQNLFFHHLRMLHIIFDCMIWKLLWKFHTFECSTWCKWTCMLHSQRLIAAPLNNVHTMQSKIIIRIILHKNYYMCDAYGNISVRLFTKTVKNVWTIKIAL